jgi:hypothetical protein
VPGKQGLLDGLLLSPMLMFVHGFFLGGAMLLIEILGQLFHNFLISHIGRMLDQSIHSMG